MAKVVVDKNTCIGCGTCEAMCPKIFKIKDGKLIPLKKDISGGDEACAKKALEACPTSSISVK